MQHQEPRDPEASARTLEQSGRLEEALGAWTRLARERPVGPARALALGEQARLLAALGRDREAGESWRRALSNDPTAPEPLAALGALALRDRDRVRLAHLRRLRFAAETRAEQRAELALAAARLESEHLHSPDAARGWILAGLEGVPDSLPLLESLADLERSRGDEAALRSALERLIAARNDRPDAAELLELASIHADAGRHETALPLLERAAERAPDQPLILDSLCEVLDSLGRHADLADALERRAALADDDAPLRAGLLARLAAIREDRLFDPEGALETWQRVVAADPEAPGALDAVTRLAAKLEPGAPAPEPAPTPAVPGFERALADLEQEARDTRDRTRLGLLVREIEGLAHRHGAPERALPWVKRWASVAPENPEALLALARIHERPGHESELVATLEALDPLLPGDRRAANRRRIAGLQQQRGLEDEALRAWQRALELDPQDEGALEALAALQRQRGERDALAETLRRRLGLCTPEARADLLGELAGLQRAAGDVDGELDALRRLEREPGAPDDTPGRIDELLAESERHEERVARWRERARTLAPDDPRRLELALREAELLGGPLGRPEAAAARYREVLAHDPESEPARLGLERALRDSFDAEGLAEVLAEQMASERDPRARERAALERATLLEEVLDRGDEALEVYRTLASQAVDDEVRCEANRRTERCLESAGDWSGLRAHWEDRLEVGTRSERIDRLERLAALCAQSLGDERGELAHLEAIAELDPGRADVWQRLAERYQRAGRDEQAQRAMEREIEAGCEPARARTLHARLADLHREAGDEARAGEHYERLFELDPSDTTAARRLIARYELEERPDALLRVLEARLAALAGGAGEGRHTDAAGDATALRIRIAEVRARQGDVEGAISALEVALGEAGAVPRIAEPLAVCYERAGYTLDLIELCRAAAGQCREPGEAANWWVRLGDAFLSRDQPREAADAYHQALTERPGDRAVQASLRAIYRRLGRSGPLAGLLEAELEHLAGQDEIPVRMELAQLEDRELGRPDAALLHARRVLQLAPLHADAFPLALALAERLERPHVALDLLDARAGRTRDAEREAELQARRARLLALWPERREEAVTAYRSALALSPRDALREELGALLEAEERWAERVELLGEQARSAAPEQRARWIERAAALAEDRLGAEAALPWLTRLRALRPRDLEVVLRIAELQRRCGRSEAQLRALEDGLALAGSPEARRDLQLERAARLEPDAPSRALAALEEARASMPDDPEVLRRLERLQQRLGRHAERAASLEALIGLCPGRAAELHAELAQLWSGPLGDARAAVPHWRAALELTPGQQARVERLRALADAQRAGDDLEGWAQTAEQELAALGDAPVFDERRRTLRRELAFAYDGPLARPTLALRHACAILDAGEDELLVPEVLARLEELVLRRLREADAPVELEARLVRHLARHPGEAALWLELARLRERRLHATGGAIEAYRRVLQLDPLDLAALRGLRGAAERLERWPDVVDALERDLAHPQTTDGRQRAKLLRRLGDVHWHRLQSTTRASRCYAAALESDGADFAALRALERLLESMEDWRGALDLYESEIEVLGDADPQRRREVWLRVAELARDQTDELDRARRALANAAEIAPLEARHLADLARLHERAGDADAHAEVLRAWCAHPEAGAGCGDWQRLALQLERLGRPGEALEAAERALALDPHTPDAWDLAARLREGRGDTEGAAQALARAAEHAAGGDAADRLLRAAGLLEPRDPQRALALLREGAGADPASVATQAALARLALAAGRCDEAEVAAAAALDLADTTSLAGPQLREVALIGGDAARARGRLAPAAGFYARARELDPADPRANAGYGEVLMAQGDPAGAREALEARLARDDDYPERARHRALLARCLEAEGELEAAVALVDRALAEDPDLDEALETSARIRQQLGRIDEAVAALERWARRAGSAEARAERLLCAAQLERAGEGRERDAEAHLRAAVAADPWHARAQLALIDHLIESGRPEEAAVAADRAAQLAPGDAELADLALRQGQAFEALGRRVQAAEAFGLAAEADPRRAFAALTQARLLRGAGEWRAAADALREFLARHPDPDHPSLADVQEQLGRLLAGPLEDVNAATLAYRRAIELDPDRLASRAALAELLSHRPGDREEAISQLRLLLEAKPTDPVCLRVALRIARANPDGAGPGTGLALLRALGVATTYEREEPSGPLPAPTRSLRDRRHEQLRCIAQEASEGIAQALEASESPVPEAAHEPEARFRADLLAAEGRLTAPALLPLPTREVAEVLSLVIRLSVAPDSVHGDGRRVNALAAALRRRERRRLRRWVGDTPVQALCETDFEQWRTEVRALAAACALHEGDHELRTALIALLRERDGSLDAELPDDADLTPRVAACPIALALMRRIVREWIEAI